MNILVTGGAGYIGSHTVVELLQAGHEVCIIDSLVNSSIDVIGRLRQITNKEPIFFQVDLCDMPSLERIFNTHIFDAVIHLAGLKAVGESVSDPLKYYSNNLVSTINLCQQMQKHDVKSLILSSSATVYGKPSELPLREDSLVGSGITNPYGQSKFQIETILKDLAAAGDDWKIIILRYFNPIGAHESGLIGEDPSGVPNNLFPVLQQVASGKREKVDIFGSDYPTTDGTGVRDYIHVVDLASGHLAALRKIEGSRNGFCKTYNLGTGKGVTVLELLRTFEQVFGKEIPYQFTKRRPGDVAKCYASPAKAKRELGWSAKKSITEACQDAWRWQLHLSTKSSAKSQKRY